MFLKEVISLYKNYKRDHKEEIAKYKLEKRLAKAPFDYRLLEEFIKLLADNPSKRKLTVETFTKDGTHVKIYFNDEGEIKRKTTVEQIMMGN